MEIIAQRIYVSCPSTFRPWVAHWSGLVGRPVTCLEGHVLWPQPFCNPRCLRYPWLVKHTLSLARFDPGPLPFKLTLHWGCVVIFRQGGAGLAPISPGECLRIASKCAINCLPPYLGKSQWSLEIISPLPISTSGIQKSPEKKKWRKVWIYLES